MRVVVNQLAALGAKTGIGHYATELLRCLREQAVGDEIDEFPRGWVRTVREAAGRARHYLDPGNTSTTVQQPGATAPKSTPLSARALRHLRQMGQTVMAYHFRRVSGRRKYDVYHETNYIPYPSDCPTVATLHDLSVLQHPEWHPADRVAYFERHFLPALPRCQHFLAISDWARHEVSKHLNIPLERITRTYMGIRQGLGVLPAERVAPVLRSLGLPERYLLCLGTIEPRKNVLMLMQIWCSLPRTLRERWPLVLVGGWGWNTHDVAEYLEKEARPKGVIHLGYLPEQHMAAVYNGARALVYPSYYEGFGLPPIEMMACGGAVLASTAGALVEVVGSRAHLIDPHDADGWRQALIRVVTDDDWWRELRSGTTELAQRFTWENCAADTLAVYRRLAGGVTLPLPSRLRAA